MVDLAGSADSRIGTYSLGMRQRLGLSAAMIGDPDVLILDEPANGLDPEGVKWLRGFLRGLAAEGRTVLVSSHLLAEVAQTADHVVIIDRGQLVTAGPIADLTRTGATLEDLFLLALRRRRRGRQVAAGYLANIAAGPAVMLEALAAPGDRARRLWALEVLASRSLLATDVLAAWATRDPDPVVALWCAGCLASAGGRLPPETGRQLLGSARAGVRAFAAGHLGDDQLTIQALRGLLLDRSGAVRSVARWRWRRQYGDPGPVYRAALSGATRPRQISAALQGLDDDHDNSLPAAAVPFLTHPNPAVRRAVAQAIGRCADADDIQHHLVRLLLDSSGEVAATALRHLRDRALPASVLATLDDAGTARSRRIALSIRQHSGTWNRVHADLAAINGHDAGLAEAARTDLLAWLQHGAATSYGQPSPGHTDRRAVRHRQAQPATTPGSCLRSRHPPARHRIVAKRQRPHRSCGLDRFRAGPCAAEHPVMRSHARLKPPLPKPPDRRISLARISTSAASGRHRPLWRGSPYSSPW
jgi:AAA domain, putative AbiEii toxin, Type IV TA system